MKTKTLKGIYIKGSYSLVLDSNKPAYVSALELYTAGLHSRAAVPSS